MITGAQVRAAKALLDWSGTRLAEEAGVAISTIRRVEACDGLLVTASIKVLQSLKNALEDGGVEFIGAPNDRPGVRLIKSIKS
jgi:transcriptional regulator with XRE-family HTH domain